LSDQHPANDVTGLKLPFVERAVLGYSMSEMHQLYELNIRTWSAEHTQALGRQAVLDDLPNDFLDRLVEDGFTWLYLVGAWTSGTKARAVALKDRHLREYLSSVLTDSHDGDICGSPFAPQSFTVCPKLGGDEALARLRERARAAGLSLMLDFVPNHVGLDHPWTEAHPDWCIRGEQRQLDEQPNAWTRIGEHIVAHGRDPFFPPWRDTVQLDYSNPELQRGMIEAASSIAARCDGLRCDMAMLQLPDVFASTWQRNMEPFWPRCLDQVRSEHPGTLFMAEVYWNREWELQQAGFDFTFDKTLYDRLLSGDTESIRAHLRATPDYQNHCLRFLENHEEQRAAARFAHPDHHRGALLLTGMVPGMLLCHHGQEDGRRLHASMQACRRPVEDGSDAHRHAYQELMRLLSEPARHDGEWQLLEPFNAAGHHLIGCLWTLPVHHSLLLLVNASWQPVSGAVHPGPLATRDCQFQDFLNGGAPYVVKADALRDEGLQATLPPWGVRAFRILPVR